jgi:23S rRNA (uracil1939-C5)-methyltransferase
MATLTDVEVEIEKLVYGGDGLARVDGQVVLAPYVLPGERIELATERVKAGLLRGRRTQILRPSPERITARCEYFSNCGGCHYQHAEYAFQLAQKRLILRETLERLGGIRYEDEIQILSSEPWQYRNRIQLHFKNRKAGFHKAASHDLCPVDRCYISSPVLNDVIVKLQTAAKKPEWPDFLRSLEVFTNEAEVQLHIVDSLRPVAARFFEWCRGFLPALTRDPIQYDVAAHSFRISRGSFFQVNRFLIDSLVQEVLGDATGEHALDLYAGVGLFSLPLSARFKNVQAVERGGPAFRDLEWNAEHSRAAIRTVKGSAGEFLRTMTARPDLILADPPRAGLGNETTAELLRLEPDRLTIVSCDPATFARDARKLITNYRIERLTLVDLFPQTYHFEVIAHFTRN